MTYCYQLANGDKTSFTAATDRDALHWLRKFAYKGTILFRMHATGNIRVATITKDWFSA